MPQVLFGFAQLSEGPAADVLEFDLLEVLPDPFVGVQVTTAGRGELVVASSEMFSHLLFEDLLEADLYNALTYPGLNISPYGVLK
jgi:hypothetical protein